MSEQFFESRTEQSKIKTEIVTKYFDGWSNIILPSVARRPNGRLAYIDLYAGPGRYDDGTESTPLLILRKALAKPELRRRLVTHFNDANSDYAASLEAEIAAFPGIDLMANRPAVSSVQVGPAVTAQLKATRLVPTLLFADPWGYKGLSADLLAGVFKDWGCDCIFFFNYSRINAAVNNALFEPHMASIFGPKELTALQGDLDGADSDLREGIIISHLNGAFKARGADHMVPFAFYADPGTRLSHHLILVSKSPKARELMVEISAPYSSRAPQRVPTYRYNPAEMIQPALFELPSPLDDLMVDLLSTFAGRTISVDQLFSEHGMRFRRRTYKDALRGLEDASRVAIDPPADKRHGTQLADTSRVTFPPRETDDG